MNSDFAYCIGRAKIKIVGAETIVQESCPRRMTCKRHLPIVRDMHFLVPDHAPKNDYICWVNAHECAKRDYVLYLDDNEGGTI